MADTPSRLSLDGVPPDDARTADILQASRMRVNLRSLVQVYYGDPSPTDADILRFLSYIMPDIRACVESFDTPSRVSPDVEAWVKLVDEAAQQEAGYAETCASALQDFPGDEGFTRDVQQATERRDSLLRLRDFLGELPELLRDRERLNWIEDHATTAQMNDMAERFAAGRNIRVIIDNTSRSHSPTPPPPSGEESR